MCKLSRYLCHSSRTEPHWLGRGGPFAFLLADPGQQRVFFKGILQPRTCASGARSPSMHTHPRLQRLPHTTYRDLLAHPDLAEVGLHPSSHLPDYCLRWLRLEGPFPRVQLVPDGAVRRQRGSGDGEASLGGTSGHCTYIHYLSLLQNNPHPGDASSQILHQRSSALMTEISPLPFSRWGN